MVMQQQLTSAPLASAFATLHTHKPASTRRPCRDLLLKSAGVEAFRHARSFTYCKRVNTAVSSSTTIVQEGGLSQVATEKDRSGRQRIKLQDRGWNFWNWRGNKIHYIKAGKALHNTTSLVCATVTQAANGCRLQRHACSACAWIWSIRVSLALCLA